MSNSSQLFIINKLDLLNEKTNSNHLKTITLKVTRTRTASYVESRAAEDQAEGGRQ